MGNSLKKNDTALVINIQKVEAKIAVIRNLEVIADADVAELYGVQTKEVNQAVRNNSDKFPSHYMFELTSSELRDLRSKILTTNVSAMNRNSTKVFTERGLYMLATILKGDQARDMTFAIIETFVKVRELKRELLDLHKETDKKKQKTRIASYILLQTSDISPRFRHQPLFHPSSILHPPSSFVFRLDSRFRSLV